MTSSLSRRAALIASAAGIGVTVAACSGGSKDEKPGEAGEVIGTMKDFKDDAFVAKTKGGADVVVVREGEKVQAFSATCPHSGCIVRKKDGALDCPCHGSLFNASTGAVERGPAKEGLAAISVKVDGENITLA
ncbi:hypothetical protein BSZ39_04970 [Bowdeniella nasicola]|uniref:Cytochrome bc1 complex Rieske iron-sulfur subunit n=1 Tax=Bowdeniella nasicola TaxID=208480 RepID=A0A1Q5Q341_9ACTO|nr:Rieske (2Fe-2S) protein [Bowdeniella nasicola]OKL54254.1 hypothetical protein BSZ39_04970 [Bowdeniella nasicola]